MVHATYSASTPRAIAAAYERDFRSIHALNHGLTGFVNGVQASGVPDAAELIDAERQHVIKRQREIQDRMRGLYYDLLDYNAERAEALPPVPLNAAQIAAERRRVARENNR